MKVVQKKDADVKKILSAISITALSVLLGLTSVLPANAGPIENISPIRNEAASQAAVVTEVQYRRPGPVHRPVYGHPGYRHPGYGNPGYHRPPVYQHGYYRGYHGYNYARPGYRRYSDGYWYPLAAFGAGVIVGGAIATQPVRGSSHAQWCANRYRSYRASDNTYQPNSGPRVQCVMR
jgi:hypothetical protein